MFPNLERNGNDHRLNMLKGGGEITATLLTMVWDGTFPRPMFLRLGRNRMATPLRREEIVVPLLRVVWDAALPKQTKKSENDHHFNRLEG